MSRKSGNRFSDKDMRQPTNRRAGPDPKERDVLEAARAPMAAGRISDDVSEDAVLGGRLRLRQPRRGHRVGHDAILLAASCPARAGDDVVDLGAGVGAAGLALATRVEGTSVALVEIDPDLAALAAEDAARNG